MVPPLGARDPELGDVVWFIPREVIPKKTKTGRTYWILKAIDSTSTITSIRCWGIRDGDKLHMNRPYMAKLDHDPAWGYSTKSIKHNFRLLG